MSFARPASASGTPIRVMIVDDSAVVRGMVSRWLDEADGIHVAAIAVDGGHALTKLAATEVDVVVMDIEMPVMSGLEALPKLLAIKPGLKVIMASTLTAKGAQVTLRALDLGASDYIAKPTAKLGGADAYRDELIQKVRELARRPASMVRPSAIEHPVAPVALGNDKRIGRPEALVIASSTGGPPALRQVLAKLGPSWTAPILIAQHMPAEFTKTLAEMLAKVVTCPVREAVSGEPVMNGVIYVAPGDHHLTVRRGATGKVMTHLDKEAPVNWCRPSADPLFASAAEAWGPSVLGLVLTGMGHDGRDGARVLSEKGGRIIAQDEASSVVWGMPGAVVGAGLADRVVALDQIGPFLAGIMSGEQK